MAVSSSSVSPESDPQTSDVRLTTAAPRTIAVFCEECFEPGFVTERGELCDRHYLARAPICESCGMAVATRIEYGYHVCDHCRNGGR